MSCSYNQLVSLNSLNKTLVKSSSMGLEFIMAMGWSIYGILDLSGLWLVPKPHRPCPNKVPLSSETQMIP